MKKCNHCNIYVGGEYEECPICQSFLEGEETENIWPVAEKLKKQSFIYKLQLFILLALAVVSLCLDMVFRITPVKYWSLVVVLAVVIIELFIKRVTSKSMTPAGWVSMLSLIIIIMLLVCGRMFGFLPIILTTCIPIVFSATLIPNTILFVLDRHENALVYLQANIALLIIPNIVMLVKKIEISIPWGISLIAAVLVALWLVIFYGRKTISEVQKRLYL